MVNLSHSTIRNCGGKYPQSHWAIYGYDIGPLRIYQCPKTFVSKEALSLIHAYDAAQATKVPYAKDMDELCASYIDLAETIENERVLIEQQKASLESLRKKNGA